MWWCVDVHLCMPAHIMCINMHILLVHNNRYKIYLYGIYEEHTDAHVCIIYNPLPLVIMVMFCILIGSDADSMP